MKYWRVYNKLDKKKNAKGIQFMKWAKYDRQFKMAAVKLAGE